MTPGGRGNILTSGVFFLTSGVFFLPNAQVSFSGQGTLINPLSAQFIAPTVTVSGHGLLYLAPHDPTRSPSSRH